MTTAPRQFGHGAKPDERDRVLRAPATDRVHRCWPSWWRYLDQRYTPRCCGYMGSHLVNSSPFRQYVDPDFLYELAKFYDEWQGEDYEGTSVRAVMKVLKGLGFFSEYRRATSAEQVARFVLEQGPVPVGTNFYAGMMHPGTGERMTLTGESLGGHAYLIRGFNRRSGLFRIKNSYGMSWGIRGDAYLAFDDLDRLLDEDGEAWAGIKVDLEGM